MHFVYIDDSSDCPTHVFAALSVPCDRWNEVFTYIRSWRVALRDEYGIPVNFELHATEFISGRGSKNKLANITRHDRAKIFHSSFRVVESLFENFGVEVISVCNSSNDQMRAFTFLATNLDRSMNAKSSFCHLICDEGKNSQYTALIRKLRVYNRVPTQDGSWEDGSSYVNKPTTRIIEDPQFKDSKTSYFVQLADFLAFGLLRSEIPTPKIKRYGLHKSFGQLEFSTVKDCNLNDYRGLGIVRS